jgi:hypothetical protein
MYLYSAGEAREMGMNCLSLKSPHLHVSPPPLCPLLKRGGDVCTIGVVKNEKKNIK